jgi:hypothetical protein
MRRSNRGREVDADGNVNRIGNLVLLPFALNAEASRRGFSEKKKIYDRHNLRQIHEITRLKDWDLAQIEKRERRIMKWSRTEWCDLGADERQAAVSRPAPNR